MDGWQTTRRRVIGTGSGLLLVALFVAGLAPACGGADGTPEGAPATPASAAVQTAPAGTTLTSLPVGPIPAGPYVTEAFEPPFSFALGQGWGSASEATGKLVINRGSINLERSVVFFTLAEVYRPDGSNAPVPDDLLAFLKAHPDLRVSEPEPVTVGGLTGVQVDFDAISASSWVRELGKCSTVPACVPLANGVVLQLQVRTMSQPDSFDVADGVPYVDWVGPSGTLQPIDLRRIARWREVSPLLTLGRGDRDDRACAYGPGDAAFRQLYVDPERSQRWPTAKTAAAELDGYLVEWADEASGTARGPEPGSCWALPTILGLDAPGYNGAVLEQEPEHVSWAEYFNTAWRGRVALLGDALLGMTEAGLAAQSLGLMTFADVTHPSRAEIDSLVAILGSLKRQGQFGAFWTDFQQSLDLMGSADIVVQSMWYPALLALRAQGVPARYAAPAEGYRAWWGGLAISTQVNDPATLDACYAYLNWWLSGLPAAHLMRSGYYSPVQEPSRAHVSPGEYAYWIEGLPADADYEGFGGVVVRKGEVRAGGSFARRACRIAAWNSNHPEIGYAAERWGEIVAG